MTRRAHDFYPTTHEGATLGLLERAPVNFGGVVFECCSGEHHMTKVLRESGIFSQVLTNDVVPSLEADFHEDARDARAWRDVFPAVDWVITNPPFGDAKRILENALAFARVGVAMYLRVTFWEPTDKDPDVDKRRGKFLEANPPNGFIALSRISHTGDGNTDSTTCGWWVWVRDSKEQWHFVLILEDEEGGAAAIEQPSLLAPPPGEDGIELTGEAAAAVIGMGFKRLRAAKQGSLL